MSWKSNPKTHRQSSSSSTKYPSTNLHHASKSPDNYNLFPIKTKVMSPRPAFHSAANSPLEIKTNTHSLGLESKQTSSISLTSQQASQFGTNGVGNYNTKTTLSIAHHHKITSNTPTKQSPMNKGSTSAQPSQNTPRSVFGSSKMSIAIQKPSNFRESISQGNSAVLQEDRLINRISNMRISQPGSRTDLAYASTPKNNPKAVESGSISSREVEPKVLLGMPKKDTNRNTKSTTNLGRDYHSFRSLNKLNEAERTGFSSMERTNASKVKDETFEIDRRDFFAGDFSLSNFTKKSTKTSKSRNDIDCKQSLIVTGVTEKDERTTSVSYNMETMFQDQTARVGGYKESLSHQNSVRKFSFSGGLDGSPISEAYDSLQKKNIRNVDEGDLNNYLSLQKMGQQRFTEVTPESGSDHSKLDRFSSILFDARDRDEKDNQNEDGDAFSRAQADKKGEALKKDNVLMKPGSANYGKYGKVYKGLDNKDSWKFDIERFQKLRRGQKVKETPKDKLIADIFKKRYDSLEQGAVTNSSIDHGSDQEQRDLLGIKKIGQLPNYQPNSSKLISGTASKFKRDHKRQLSLGGVLDSPDVNSRNEKSKEKNLALFEDNIIPNRNNQELEDLSGGTMDYLQDLRTNELLDVSKSTNDDQSLSKVLSSMKEEVEKMGGVKDKNEREKLETKLVSLLDVTLKSLATLTEKKNETLKAYNPDTIALPKQSVVRKKMSFNK